MRTNEATYFATDRASVVLKLIDLLTATVKRYLAYRQRQADLAVLCGMTDRELKDIGVYRADNDDVA